MAEADKKAEKETVTQTGPTVASPEFMAKFGTKAEEGYESPLMRFVKDSGVDISGEFEIKNGWIRRATGGNSLATRGSLDLHYKQAFIKKRDERTLRDLPDQCFFKWYFPGWDLQVERRLKGEESKTEAEIKAMDLTQVIDYVLPLERIAVKYPHACNPITFTLLADDPMKGFSVSELKTKLHAYYDMMLYVGKHYDPKTRKCSPTPVLANTRESMIYFGYSGGNDGISGVVYNKARNEWCVEQANYC